MRIKLQNRLEGLGGTLPLLQTMEAQPELALRITMIGIRGGHGGVTFGSLLDLAQLELQIAAQDVKIGAEFAGDRKHIQCLPRTALGAQCQRRPNRIVDGRCRDSGGNVEWVHGRDATAVRVAPFLINVKRSV